MWVFMPAFRSTLYGMDGNRYLPAWALLSSQLLSWWFLLSLFVSHLRKHFNRRGLILLNRIIGSVLMLVGVGGIVLSVFPGLLSR